MNNLSSIFNAIIPENLKNTPAINDSVQIFIELLEENSKVSLSANNFFNDNVTEKTKEELIKIYLYDYYSLLHRLKSDFNIVERFKSQNKILRPYLYENDSYDSIVSTSTVVNYFIVGGSVLNSSYSGPEFDNVLGSEININPIYSKLGKLEDSLLKVKPDNFYFNRLFKEKKGFISSMRFIYDCLNEHLISEDEQLELQVIPSQDPFKLSIKGSIDTEVYRAGVEYLTHPLGFVYSYEQIKQIKLEDYFFFKYEYSNEQIEVRCLYGNSEFYNKQISEVLKYNGTIKVVFTDLTALIQEHDEVKYYDDSGRILKKYPIDKHCSIFLKYDLIYRPMISDSISFKLSYSEIDNNDVLTDSLTFNEKFISRNAGVIGEFVFDNSEKYGGDSNKTEEFNDEFVAKSKQQVNLEETYDKQIQESLISKIETNITEVQIDEYSEELKFKENIVYNGSIIGIGIITDINPIIIAKEVEFINQANLLDEFTPNYINNVGFESVYDKEITDLTKIKINLSELDDGQYNFNDFIQLDDGGAIIDSMHYSDNSYTNELKTKLTDSYIIEDEFKIFSTEYLNDNLEIQDDVLYSLNISYDKTNVIGEGNIDIVTPIIISDVDVNPYYKYKDNITLI